MIATYLPKEATVNMTQLLDHIEQNNTQFFKDELPTRHKFIIQPYVIKVLMEKKRFEILELILQYVESNNIELGWKLPRRVLTLNM